MTTAAAKKNAAHGLAGMYKKIFDCIPAIEAQQPHTIIAELKRIGVTADKALLAKYLPSLIEEGFVVRVGADRYMRKPIGATVMVVADQSLPVDESHPQESTSKIIADIASEVRDCASHFAGRLKAIADRIEGAAILIDKDKEAESEAAAKLRQLQAILKGL